MALALAIGHDSRIGRHFLSPGLGFGGGCLPKDIRAFRSRAAELGVEQALEFLRDIDEINMRRRQNAAEIARELVGGSLLGKTIAVLGAAFKPDSDDVRDSPALNVACRLHLAGAYIRVHDPEATDNARAQFPALDYALEVEKTCEDADLVLHLTEWKQYRDLDPAALARVVRVPRVLDARNTLDVCRWTNAGWHVHALGRSRASGARR
jgi:UDPglucose 6-dehydrogenase